MVLTTMRTSNAREHLSWLDYYVKAAEELQGPIAAFENGCSVCDSLVESYIDDTTKFIDKIERNPNFSFLLLPSASKGVLNVTHCNALFEDASETRIMVSLSLSLSRESHDLRLSCPPFMRV